MEIKDIKQLGEQINAQHKELEGKISANETALKSVQDEIKAKGENTELTAKLETVQKEYTDSFKELKELQTKQQEQVDAIETKMKRIGQGDEGKQSYKQHIRSVVEDSAGKLEQVGKGNLGSVKLDLKADMTVSSDFTGDVIRPDLLPGVYADPLRAAHIRDHMNVTATSSDTVDYVQLSATSDNAGTTSEGSAAGQTDFDFTQADAPVRKINTYLTISKEMMNDAAFVANFIQTRATNLLLNKEDQQLLNGTGVAPQISGIIGGTNYQAYTDILGDSNVNEFDILAEFTTNARVDEYIPNLALVHPNDYFQFLTAKDGNNSYILPNIFTGAPIVVNGARLVQTTAMTERDLLVGDFMMGCTLAIREDVTVTFSNQHSDNFTKGFITILIEERIALPIYRTNAFVYGTIDAAWGKATG